MNILRKIIGFPVIFACVFSLFLLLTILVTSSPPAATNPLDGCVYLYLDMGTNIGVQIRKLFEPEKFPHSPVKDVFRKYFFSHNNSREIQPSEVCAVGWEPNPRMTNYLKRLEKSFQRCGHRVTIFTETGVGTREDSLHFAAIQHDLLTGDFHPMYVASHFFTEEDTKKNTMYSRVMNATFTVPVIRIADFINNVVATRSLPADQPGAVVMKLDVEGMEVAIVSDLIMSGALAHIDNVHVDWPLVTITDEDKLKNDESEVNWMFDETIYKFWKSITNLGEVINELDIKRKTEISSLDDETFATFTEDFPSC